MARYLYISTDAAAQARATTLGCGLLPAVPPEFATLATAPCVIVAGAGQVVVVSDNPPTTPGAVTTAAAPIVSAEAAAAAAAATLAANAATITANVTAAQTQIQAFIAANPGGATLNGPQTIVLAKMLNGLCKILLQQYGSTTGT